MTLFLDGFYGFGPPAPLYLPPPPPPKMKQNASSMNNASPTGRVLWVQLLPRVPLPAVPRSVQQSITSHAQYHQSRTLSVWFPLEKTFDADWEFCTVQCASPTSSELPESDKHLVLACRNQSSEATNKFLFMRFLGCNSVGTELQRADIRLHFCQFASWIQLHCSFSVVCTHLIHLLWQSNSTWCGTIECSENLGEESSGAADSRFRFHLYLICAL